MDAIGVGVDEADGDCVNAGGKDKGLHYAAYDDAIATRVRALVLIGETAGKLEALVAGARAAVSPGGA